MLQVREKKISLRKWPGGTAHAQLRRNTADHNGQETLGALQLFLCDLFNKNMNHYKGAFDRF